MVILAMLSAIAFVVMCVGRIPILLWLKYDPKDVIIAIGGFLFGPLSALLMSVVVSLVEMITGAATTVESHLFLIFWGFALHALARLMEYGATVEERSFAAP